MPWPAMPADPRTPAGARPAGLGAGPSPHAGPALAGVIFDMDGVIVDSEPLSMGTLAEMAAERGIDLEPALLGDLIGVSLEDVLDILAARLDAAPAAAGVDAGQLRRDYHERYLPRLRAAAVPTPGLERLVGGLATAGVPVAIASSSTLAEIDAVVSAVGLRGVLRAVASGEEVARRKPAPDVYLLAIERLGAGPGGVVAIEDSATGVAAATAAGLVCVAVRTAATRGHDFGQAALVVGSLEELDAAILGRLVRDRPARD
jgi:HAD superfamily hydrolase (TIGR01509 family)